MRYIETLREGERICDVYLVKSKASALTKSGKPYDNVILQDKTGTLDAKIWDPGSGGIEEFDAMDYIEINGDINSFQGKLQCSAWEQVGPHLNRHRLFEAMLLSGLKSLTASKLNNVLVMDEHNF